MEELKQMLMEVLNNAQMPLDAKYYTLKDLYRDVKEYYYSELEKLKQKGSEENVTRLDTDIQQDQLAELSVNGNAAE